MTIARARCLRSPHRWSGPNTTPDSETLPFGAYSESPPPLRWELSIRTLPMPAPCRNTAAFEYGNLAPVSK